MNTSSEIDFKQRTFNVYRQLVRSGEYLSAVRLLRAMHMKRPFINISLSDVDWTIGIAFGLAHLKVIRIR